MNHPRNHPLANALTEQDVVDYLRNTSDFFERHAELLTDVQLSSPYSQRAVSLQERQAEMLRAKIKGLELRVMEMVRHGNDNGVLFDKLLQLACQLHEVQDLAQLPDLLCASIAQLFDVPQVAIRVWAVAPAWSQAAFAQEVGEDAKLFVSSLSEPFSGPNTGFDVVRWLPDPSAAQSLAFLPLRHEAFGRPARVIGMLLLASPDAQRYSSTMSTDVLAQIAKIASAALRRLA